MSVNSYVFVIFLIGLIINCFLSVYGFITIKSDYNGYDCHITEIHNSTCSRYEDIYRYETSVKVLINVTIYLAHAVCETDSACLECEILYSAHNDYTCYELINGQYIIDQKKYKDNDSLYVAFITQTILTCLMLIFVSGHTYISLCNKRILGETYPLRT